MHKIKDSESDINSDDCDATAQDCIYSFSSPKKQKIDISNSSQNSSSVKNYTDYQNEVLNNKNSRTKGNDNTIPSNTDYTNSNQLNISELKKKQNNCEYMNVSNDEKETNDDNDDDSEYQLENADDENSDENMNTSEEFNDGKENKENENMDEELNEIIDEEYFKEIIPAIPRDILGTYITCLKTCGFEREVQLDRMINLLGDLRDPISVIQVLGLPGMGKTKVVKSFIKLLNVPYAYVNCLMAVYQSGKSAKNAIYHTILKDLSVSLLKEFDEYKKINNITDYQYDPTKLVPNHVSNTDVFFSTLHKLLSFTPENEFKLKKTYKKIKENDKKVKNIKINEKPKQNKFDKATNKLNRISCEENKQLEDEQNNTKKNRIKIYSNKNYYKDKLYDRSVVFILDNIRYLVRTHPDLFYALTRIHEYIKGPYNDLSKANKTTRGLCVILINRSPLPDEIFDGLPQPPTVWFDSYTSDMCKNILYRLYSTMCFESLLTYNDKDLKIYYTTNNNQRNNGKEFVIKKNNVVLENDVIYDIWCRYIDYIINVSYKDYKSDFHELLFICSHMWPLFIKPIIDGALEPIVENMNALQRNIDTHIRVATYNHGSHFTFELTDSVFLNQTNLKNKIDLSFYSKILLLGAYLASRNSPLTDKRFFNATVKGGAFNLPKKRKTRNSNESILTLIGQSIPKIFTFIRWLCLTDCLLVCFFDEQLILNSLICQQINSLIQLGFVSYYAPNNLSCLVRNSIMNGVQWSGFCGSTLLNSANNFAFLNNSVFCETNNSITYDPLDPYTKLTIQVPEETIRTISKELKIPLDELIL
ncbi:origin recognition complex subunit 5, putative [Plasmodium berghei]|uniref:Origin recognition complex subunit 5, putative n=2 Tax=Plasmodium berghei TaxID=5821 RepID=A0A509ADH7_PLABA|nr:origin recognition complex subunit 5, putative [Plasmodium berghei ANKA]CXH96062.1 origin recognition complex subunit 5, putative [Plasmodium berghei]SCL91096.1 origin recognition complex subunit 5, putative [Plasmodium berghei]SCM15423.1 origin recognition complex subunit 5, putative [Plasmodium berghei]SCM17218.1 origin recognition complex subunit 5, putative [Plasmodium berghei]SCN22300.1 origin recognition complex subunit 5, putative [Plasmodium berghei]|eukprot:XP_034420008.1 origin recognition complex subunit 5, putative [Plasmodium berghei ANKA]